MQTIKKNHNHLIPIEILQRRSQPGIHTYISTTETDDVSFIRNKKKQIKKGHDFSKMYNQPLPNHIISEYLNDGDEYILLIDGVLQKSDIKKVQILSQEKACQQYGFAFKEHFENPKYHSKNCHEAYEHPTNLMCIFIPPNSRSEHNGPIKIINIVNQTHTFSLPHTVLYIGKNNSVKIQAITTSQCNTTAGFNQQVNVLYLAKNSNVNIDLITNNLGNILSESHTTIVAQEHSTCQLNEFHLNVSHHQSINKGVLEGSHSNISMHGLGLLKHKQCCAYNITMQHESTETTSNQLYKNILDNNSQGHFKGFIEVAKHATGTQAYQLNKNLLLSEQAKMSSFPYLNILNDDVKASHGCTNGYFNEESLFYIQSRGLSKTDAEKLLILGFISDLTRHITENNLKVQIETLLSNILYEAD